MGKNKMAPPPIEKASGRFRTREVGVFKPPKIVLVGVEGWGKTTTAAHVPDVALMIADTETGYDTLLGVDRVPAVPCVTTSSWRETLEVVGEIGDAGALALDELSGFEKQCHNYVCANDFKNDWVKFYSYGRGPQTAMAEWGKLLARLEQLEIPVVALAHCAIETFRDPAADDYSRYVAALSKPTWGATRRWGDAVLFGTFESQVVEGKGVGGTDRVLHTEHRDAYDAKNRYAMDPEIDIPDDPTKVWETIWAQVTR